MSGLPPLWGWMMVVAGYKRWRVKGLRKPFHREQVVLPEIRHVCGAFYRQLMCRALKGLDSLVYQKTHIRLSEDECRRFPPHAVPLVPASNLQARRIPRHVLGCAAFVYPKIVLVLVEGS